MVSYLIKIPSSSANIGPGFDALGIALSLYLTLKVTIPGSSGGITISCEGEGKDLVNLDPKENLITKTALQVAKAVSKTLPESISIHCKNEISLGSGLGSSGSAVVAGVCLANLALNLNLTKQQLLNFCLFIEGHPDNVSPSLLGGFISAYMREDFNFKKNDADSPTMDLLACSDKPIGRYIRLPISDSIRAVTVTPNFQLPTVLARKALPDVYPKADVIFNIQRVSVLIQALGLPDSEIKLKENSSLIFEAMRDKIHQNYRQHLIPGLPEILGLEQDSLEGLLGISISGAGPTVLALATSNFGKIGETIQNIFAKQNTSDGKRLDSIVRILDIDRNGVVIEQFE
ncbi:hypothetical protein HK099_006801 [Clydaea vesicula]|uniref:GHMP kinase N-terminal domain-containing protein n=1 Tax=Clydaea vesicula TaxID=447962 RepID=A0AAD5U9T2_9FUNG|nr:hypothetical protein HK099_006801 [Clydaea vesicula]KAJ3393937.1 hypothetical protein HDU92_007417 [Lobulomyces angularis]